jgi:Outer membrane protein beta-barrel domain
MINKTSLAVLIAGFTLAGSLTAEAQTQAQTSVYINVNYGGQLQARTFTGSTSFPLYGETAVINSAQSVDSGGVFDFAGGYRVMSHLSLGLGYSSFSSSGDGTITGSIPSPTVFNNPKVSTVSATDLHHKETGTHLVASWMVPIAKQFDATISGGFSFFRVTQDILTATVPAGTQDMTAQTQESKGDSNGANFGVSLNYMPRVNYGVGLYVRYAGATVSLPSVGDMKVGGTQIGGGLRLRF